MTEIIKGNMGHEPSSSTSGDITRGERYDAMQALKDAEETRPVGVVFKPLGVVLAEIAAMPQSEDEVLWPDWNREIRGREWG